MATDRASAYADWLVQNQDKQGTQQFATVANAYKQLRQQGRQQQGTDGAFAYGVDRAQQMAGKGIEVVGNLVGSETIAQTGSNIVAQQEKDIAAGGYTPTYTGSLADTYKDGGISAAIGWIGEKTAENAASGGLAIAGTGAAALTAPFSTTAALVLGGGTLATSTLMGAGEAAQEQEDKTGEYDARVASGVGVLIGILDRFGAGKVIPKSKLATMSGEEVVDALMKAGKPNAAAAIGRRIAGSTLGEAGTEVAQEGAVVGSTAAMGGEYTSEELRDRALESAVLGGTIGGGARAGIETAGAAGRGVRAAIPGGYTPTDPEAAADLANRLQAIADRDGYDLANVKVGTENKGARAAVDQAHSEITTDLDDLRSVIKQAMEVANTDSEAVRNDKVALKRAFKQARTKTKNSVGSEELAAAERLIGNTQEGQQIIRLFRQSNSLTELHNLGYKGGVSQYTDALSPLPSGTGYSDRALIELPTRLGLSGAAAGVTGGASIPAQIGAVAAGRGIDALTTRRSRVAKFVRDQQAQQGTGDPTAQSVRAARALAQQQQEEADAAEAQRQRDLAMDATRRNAPPKGDPNDPNPSPQYLMESQTGLTRTGVARALRIIERTVPGLANAVETYRQMLITGQQSADLTPLIREVKRLVRDNASTFEDVRTDQPQAEAQTDDRRERGKAANMKEIARLQREVNDSNGIAVNDKALLNQALEEFKQPLGADPVAAAQSIVDEVQANLRKPELADKYLNPYVKRIVRQQKRSKRSTVEDAPKKVQPDPEPAPDVPEPLQQTGMYAPIDPETYDVDQPYYHGTAAAFREFDGANMGALTGVPSAKAAFWFSDDPETAASYANFAANYAPVQLLLQQAQQMERDGADQEDIDIIQSRAEMLEDQFYENPEAGQNIIPVYLPKNLKVIDMDGQSYDPADMNLSEDLQKAREEGFAGVKFTNFSDPADYSEYRPATHIAIFNPEDIRSQFAPKTRAEAKSLLSMASMLGLTGVVTALQALLGDDEEDRGILMMPQGALTT